MATYWRVAGWFFVLPFAMDLPREVDLGSLAREFGGGWSEILGEPSLLYCKKGMLVIASGLEEDVALSFATGFFGCVPIRPSWSELRHPLVKTHRKPIQYFRTSRAVAWRSGKHALKHTPSFGLSFWCMLGSNCRRCGGNRIVVFSVAPCVGGLNAWPIDRFSIKDQAKVTAIKP